MKALDAVQSSAFLDDPPAEACTPPVVAQHPDSLPAAPVATELLPAAPIATPPASAPAKPTRPAPLEPVRPSPAVRSMIRPPQPGRAQRWYDAIEAFLSRLSMRDNFWHSVCSLIWLPLAFFSGIRMKQINADTFFAVLPFRRFNRNWYRAMAGGALLANSEIAGGMYVFGICGGDYTVVCKNLNYTFLRPCFGPAIYRMTPRENIREALAKGGEFNITLDLEISQQAARQGEKDKRVGRCEATFHVTPKIQHKIRAARKLTKH
jgi:acyl-coenzyme A thioesterase PaaI-like protein